MVSLLPGFQTVTHETYAWLKMLEARRVFVKFHVQTIVPFEGSDFRFIPSCHVARASGRCDDIEQHGSLCSRGCSGGTCHMLHPALSRLAHLHDMPPAKPAATEFSGFRAETVFACRMDVNYSLLLLKEKAGFLKMHAADSSTASPKSAPFLHNLQHILRSQSYRIWVRKLESYRIICISS